MTDVAPSIVAIIVTFESAGVLPACLDALAREGIAAIIVDNASRDDTIDVARRAGAAVISNALNEGFGRGMNIGAEAASDAHYLLLLNPDAIVRPGFRVAMLQAAGRYEDAGVFGPRIIGPRNELFFPTRSLLSPYLINERKRACQPEGDCCAPFLSGSCYLLRRSFFIDIGGFDSNIFLFYEDNDLCRRVADTGRSIIFVNDAVMEHAQGRSSAPAPGRAFRARWHYAWSQGYVCRKYGLKSPSPGTFLRNSLKYFATLLTGSSLKRERYGGAAAGAWASMTGQSALDREGLN